MSSGILPPPGGGLAPLFRPSPATGAVPVAARTGILATWNPITGNNSVLVDGVPLVNLPIVAAQALTLAPGDTIMLHLIGGSWYIVGQVVEPGSDRAKEMLAARTYAQTISTNDITSSTGFVDLLPSGPLIEDVPVPQTGRLLITWSALIGWSFSPAGANFGGSVSLEYTGANDHPADFLLTARHIESYGTSDNRLDECHVSRTEVLTGLTPGKTTFRLKYASQNAGVNTNFSHRHMSIVLL